MLKAIPYILITILLIMPAPQDHVGQTQSQSDQEACNKYREVDAELNEVYNRILDQYKQHAAFVEKLKIAQARWLAFRDAELEAIYPETNKRYYGSVYTMCRCTALIDITSQRTKRLRQWLEGTPEGDVCAGSIKTKN